MRWVARLGTRLINPVVIDAVRSWFATLSGVAASAFSFIIVLLALFYAEVNMEVIFMTALVLTHIEAILCLFYLQRLSLESLKGKIGVVELEMETTNGGQSPVQQTVRTTAYGSESTISTSGPVGPVEIGTGLPGSGGGSDTSAAAGAVRSGTDEAGRDSDMDSKV